MFKRANKITSLLIAAAAVVSLVPASAADYDKVDSQDGIVYDAVAYKDGAAVIDGEIDDNDGVYFLADGKYTELEDIDSGSELSAYGTKYAKVDDGDDYSVDLSSGSVIDDNQAEEDEDDAASSLRKKIKEVDRYTDNDEIVNLLEVPGAKFGDDWYYTDSSDTNAYTVAMGTGVVNTKPEIYTDKDGNYIDADYNLGKIKVGTTGAGANETVTVENTVDEYTVSTNNDTNIKIAKTEVLGQDADYIYRYAVLTVTSTADAHGQIYVNNKALNATGNTVTLNVIQKISKAQASDDIEDAKYAKTVYNYVIGDDAGKQDSDAINFVDNASGATVVGGKLAVYSFVNDDIDDNVQVQAMTLKQKNGFYYTDLEDVAKITAEFSDDLDETAFELDVDGNIYVLDGGYIKEFDGTDDWNKVYKVDGSFDSLSVYDKDNMIAWSQDDEVYSLIGGTTEAPVETPEVKTGWAQATDGTWTYVKADGTKATGWLNLGGTWYYLKADGVMATGWVQDAGTWYYLAGSGAMQTGWLNDNGTWYYLAGSGAMLANTTVDGYVLGASGAWVK